MGKSLFKQFQIDKIINLTIVKKKLYRFYFWHPALLLREYCK